MNEIKKILEVLAYHQEWRKGAEMRQTDPKELTSALDGAIEILKANRWRKVSEEFIRILILHKCEIK